MHENSHCFRELDIRELLEDQEAFATDPPKAYNYIKNN
jgi:hypothetical protein